MALGRTASHIGFKLVGKPQAFSGSESGWIEWSFQMKACIMHRDVTDVQCLGPRSRRESHRGD